MTTPAPAATRLASNSPPQESASLVEMLLAEQHDLTAVERFAQHHGESQRAEERYYRSLIPASPPGPGQQYGFEVDLDRCSGCKACVTACHVMNGLDEQETWRDVGLLFGGSQGLPIVQHVTTACHHCLSPACLSACPVNAYEKDPQTGIVKHLDDQCFGCQYCTLACPYDVPKYHAGKGIVRKCDMCSSRLAVGEPPACVQACPHEAISIKVVDVAEAVEDAEAAWFLPAAPDPQITYPTTTYKTRRVWPRNMLPADYFQVNPQHPHGPLVLMLVLTQLSVGAFATGVIFERSVGAELAQLVLPTHGVTALVFGLVALLASLFHLGRPRYAYRAVLGLRHSWLSREIVAFGAFAGLACAYAGSTFLPNAWGSDLSLAVDVLAWSVVSVGGVSLFCSIMIYASLGREFWSFGRTTTRFLLTAALLGTATVWMSVVMLAVWRPSSEVADAVRFTAGLCCPALMLIATTKLAWEASLLRHRLSRSMTPLKRSAMLMTRDLSNFALARFALGALGGIAMPALLMAQVANGGVSEDRIALAVMTGLLFLACLAGELCERYLFFAAVTSPRMPGAVR